MYTTEVTKAIPRTRFFQLRAHSRQTILPQICQESLSVTLLWERSSSRMGMMVGSGETQRMMCFL